VIDKIVAGDVDADGRVLYTEASGPASQQFAPDGPPGEYGDLWLATGPTRVRGEVCRFYAREATLPPAPSCNAGDLRDIHWTGHATFVALSGSGIVRGEISASGATFTGVPGGVNVTNYALIAGGTAAIVVSGNLTVYRVSFADGATVAVATLPPTAGSALLDVGCHPDLCVVLANGGGTLGGSSLWRVDLVTGAATLARAFDHRIDAAKLSPVSGDVVALEGANLYLLAHVLP
jgi:hypothetical protein